MQSSGRQGSTHAGEYAAQECSVVMRQAMATRGNMFKNETASTIHVAQVKIDRRCQRFMVKLIILNTWNSYEILGIDLNV